MSRMLFDNPPPDLICFDCRFSGSVDEWECAGTDENSGRELLCPRCYAWNAFPDSEVIKAGYEAGTTATTQGSEG